MRLGIQTILWGPQLDDPRRLISQLATMGFEAIELAQHPEFLLRAGLDAQSLKQLLHDEGMTLLGFTVGSLEERARYCGSTIRPLYYYIEWADEQSIDFAKEKHLRLALHAHVYKQTSRV